MNKAQSHLISFDFRSDLARVCLALDTTDSKAPWCAAKLSAPTSTILHWLFHLQTSVMPNGAAL
jgi:hypothetical protein